MNNHRHGRYVEYSVTFVPERVLSLHHLERGDVAHKEVWHIHEGEGLTIFSASCKTSSVGVMNLAMASNSQERPTLCSKSSRVEGQFLVTAEKALKMEHTSC